MDFHQKVRQYRKTSERSIGCKHRAFTLSWCPASPADDTDGFFCSKKADSDAFSIKIQHQNHLKTLATQSKTD